MADTRAPAPRKPRADAVRNRALLLETAKIVFAAKGPGASLDAIAETAGVGIGTLYRHFPTRDALVQEAYRFEALQLAASAEQLASTLPPVEALRQWLLLFIDYFTTKKLIVSALSPATSTAALFAMSTNLLSGAIEFLAARAEQSGAIRLSVSPLDLLRAISGIANLSDGPGWEDGARQLVDVLIAGMKVSAP